MPSSQRTRLIATTAAVAIALTLTACSAPPWETGDAGNSATPKPSSTKVPDPVSNDLSSGSTERTLTTGPLVAGVDYWSTLSMDQWTADALKPINLSMLVDITPADGQKVYLQRASMVAVPFTAAGALAPLAPVVDSATVNPGYLVLNPYSYSQVFNVGQVPEDATGVRVEFTYDFLVQTTPTSSEYAKQTATDTLSIAIATTDSSQ